MSGGDIVGGGPPTQQDATTSAANNNNNSGSGNGNNGNGSNCGFHQGLGGTSNKDFMGGSFGFNKNGEEVGGGSASSSGSGSPGGVGGRGQGVRDKVCRDFIRNVCQRQNCRFLHPENARVRTDPIFCHDFQIGRCFRSNCKFIHCTKEEQEVFSQTGQLPMSIGEKMAMAARRGVVMGQNQKPLTASRGGNGSNGSISSNNSADEEMVPICKDFLRGICDRGTRCKYRHFNPSQTHTSPPPPPPVMERPVMVRSRSGRVMMMVPVMKRGYEFSGHHGPPEPKRHCPPSYFSNHFEVEEVFFEEDKEYELEQDGGNSRQNGTNKKYNGRSNYYPGPETVQDTIKALEDENFMLKRRIEELKSSNEFLLSQNAQLRLNNSLGVGTSVAQVQPLAVSAVQVSAAGPSAQPSIIGITSSSQPLPTISISTLPTAVTPVSISQTQIQPASQPQLFLPAPPN